MASRLWEVQHHEEAWIWVSVGTADPGPIDRLYSGDIFFVLPLFLFTNRIPEIGAVPATVSHTSERSVRVNLCVRAGVPLLFLPVWFASFSFLVFVEIWLIALYIYKSIRSPKTLNFICCEDKHQFDQLVSLIVNKYWHCEKIVVVSSYLLIYITSFCFIFKVIIVRFLCFSLSNSKLMNSWTNRNITVRWKWIHPVD